MAEFLYDALANNGQRSQGTLIATSEREAMAMLDARGLFPVKIAPTKPGAVVGFIVLNILIIYFVPQFKPIFDKLEEKGQLPGLTQALMATSNTLQKQMVWLILGVGAAIYIYRRWAATPSGRVVVDGWRLRV